MPQASGPTSAPDDRRGALTKVAAASVIRVNGVVGDWISVAYWYKMLNMIGLTPGKPLQRLAEREWYASRRTRVTSGM